MSKQKQVSFQKNPSETESQIIGDSKALADDIIKKHTLDSDEEDVQDNQDDRMEDDDIEGQEDDTIAFDGSTTITPFNMREEMETGHFDKTGTYIFDKETEIKDSWMDDIDWVKVKQNAKAVKEKELESSDSEPEEVDELSLWKEMVSLMLPGETVAKSLRRLGGGNKKLSSAQRLKAKKLGIKPTEEEIKNKEFFQTLTSLADKFIQSGYMEIYDDTYEKIAYKIQEKEQPIKKVPEKLPENEEDALDMFGDEFDEKVAKSESKNNDEPVSKKRKVEPVATAPSSTDDIQWEYKQTDEESAEICGPFTSSQMQQFVDDNKFPGGVYVRKVGAGSDFYSSKRIDFELYT